MKNNGKKIVIYYSYTGHTKMIAEKIKEILQCDILELKPVKKYSTNYDLVVEDEQNNSSTGKIVEIEKINIDLEEYDEIILGTPVWWYSIAPVVRAFLKENNLSCKKIIPFATNAGWLGKTFNEIKELCQGSRVEKEKSILFTENYKENKLMTPFSEIKEWIESI